MTADTRIALGMARGVLLGSLGRDLHRLVRRLTGWLA